jgi:hypothetical protein
MEARPIEGDPIGGGGGGTGGSTGATTTTTTTTTGAVSPAAKFGGGGSGTGQFPVVVDNDGASGFGTKCGPGIDVPNGCVVEVYPYEKNTVAAYVAKGPDEARTGPRSAHTPTAPVMTYTVGNLSEIWVYAKAGEGVLLRIQRRA